jgi:hypothetical protein
MKVAFKFTAGLRGASCTTELQNAAELLDESCLELLLQVSNLTMFAPLGAAKTDPAADNNAVLEDAMLCFGFFFLSSPFSRRTRITTTITTNSNKTTGKNFYTKLSSNSRRRSRYTISLNVEENVVLTDTDQELEGVDDDIGCWRRGSHGCHGGHMAVTQNRQVGRRRRELHVA